MVWVVLFFNHNAAVMRCLAAKFLRGCTGYQLSKLCVDTMFRFELYNPGSHVNETHLPTNAIWPVQAPKTQCHMFICMIASLCFLWTVSGEFCLIVAGSAGSNLVKIRCFLLWLSCLSSHVMWWLDISSPSSLLWFALCDFHHNAAVLRCLSAKALHDCTCYMFNKLFASFFFETSVDKC